ncbi:methylamine utilization protein MauE [Streptomyces sp. ISL-10]|uniref:MauE/DoxX family redox-associated membrane protein n=1 Tax=Streptomyces sp. ISL-10 TaxID=2819172 RepID=UPI001BE720F3|nr:MauE/DoxX family redox-associated membrane protein [Streptomyces sp. ISL-10]MBT2369921.1 methylamine utilization protein MauE [Streptomyces sp. ISL-10]
MEAIQEGLNQVQYMVIGSCCVIGTVFLVASVSKLRGRAQFEEFAESVQQLGLVPRRWGRPVAVLAAGGEVLVPFVLASPLIGGGPPAVASAFLSAPAFGLGLAVVLLLAFTTAIALAMRRGSGTSCRCFGTSSAPLGVQHVVRNLLLAALAVAGLVGALTHRLSAVEYLPAVTAGGVGVVVAILCVFLDDIIDLFSPQPSGESTRLTR